MPHFPREELKPEEPLSLFPGKFLVVDTGAEIPLPADKSEVLVGRTDPAKDAYPDVDLTPFGGEQGGVSRLHARLILEGTKVYIEDLNSTNFTFINREKLGSGQRYQLKTGDEIRFGLLALNYVTK
jgi:pSer/pThr/pTyr-binding forkhead associated (FHA) protein